MPVQLNGKDLVTSFSDYEEGTWTPAYTFATPGDLSVVYTIQKGRYTKVGRIVTLEITLDTSTFTHTTASGDLQITGLPFTIGGISGAVSGSCLIWDGLTVTNYTVILAQMVQGDTRINFRMAGSEQGLSALLSTHAITATDKILRGTIVYSI